MKDLTLFLLVACSWAEMVTCGIHGSCSLEQVIEEVAVNVVSEAAALLMSNSKKLGKTNTCRQEKVVLDKIVQQYPANECLPKDCADIDHQGHSQSGVFRVWPDGWRSCGMNVYCDLEKDGGGWTVIQRRGDFGKPNDYFYRKWRDYKFGFGNISEDFWLGNDKIFHLTNQDNYVLRVYLRTKDGEESYAQYDEFFIENESNKYKLWINSYTGDAGNSFENQNGQYFTTSDKDNDSYDKNCAVEFKGAWWYNKCHLSNLNGLYLNGQHETFANGVNWHSWKGYHYSYQDVVMKIRPKGFVKQEGSTPVPA